MGEVFCLFLLLTFDFLLPPHLGSNRYATFMHNSLEHLELLLRDRTFCDLGVLDANHQPQSLIDNLGKIQDALPELILVSTNVEK
jgi:hypothetical protein